MKRALDLVPADVPARGVAIDVAKGERVAAAFLFVRDRWVWIWDLERLSTLLALTRARSSLANPHRR